jgi:CheY-like chemotaxis protein
MPRLDGIEATRRLLQDSPHTGVLVTTRAAPAIGRTDRPGG